MKKLSIIFLMVLFAFSQNHKNMKFQDNQMKKMKRMKHVNPLPNFMKVVVKSGEKLNLSEDQKKQLNKWREEKNPIAQAYAKQIISIEKDIKELAFKNAPKNKIMAKVTEINSLRTKIAEMKINCRDNMTSILSEEQWKRVKEIYPKLMNKMKK